MADFNMGGMPPMGLPMGGGYGEVLGYNPGWIYGNAVASSDRYVRRREPFSFASCKTISDMYSKDTHESRRLRNKAEGSTQKQLYKIKSLIKTHTKLVRENYAIVLILNKLTALKNQYGSLGIPKDSIKAADIQSRIDSDLCERQGNIFDFSKSVLSPNTDYYNRGMELAFIKHFISKAIRHSNNKNWHGDTLKKAGIDFQHYFSCLTVYGYHNYNIYSLQVDKLKKDGFVAKVNDIKEKLEQFNYEEKFNDLLNLDGLSLSEVKANLAEYKKRANYVMEKLNELNIEKLFEPPVIDGMFPDMGDYNDLYSTYVDGLLKQKNDLLGKITKGKNKLSDHIETLSENAKNVDTSKENNDVSNENEEAIQEEEHNHTPVQPESVQTDSIENEPVQVTPVQPEPVQTSPVENEPVRKAPSQPKPVQKKVENTSPEHSHSDNVVRIKQEDLDFWRNLIDDYLAMQDEKKNDNHFVATPEVERDMQLVEMLSNIDEDEVDFTNMKGFKK